MRLNSRSVCVSSLSEQLGRRYFLHVLFQNVFKVGKGFLLCHPSHKFAFVVVLFKLTFPAFTWFIQVKKKVIQPLNQCSTSINFKELKSDVSICFHSLVQFVTQPLGTVLLRLYDMKTLRLIRVQRSDVPQLIKSRLAWFNHANTTAPSITSQGWLNEVVSKVTARTKAADWESRSIACFSYLFKIFKNRPYCSD